MTLEEAIGRFDALYPNAMDHRAKRDALSAFDGRLYAGLLTQFEGAPEAFVGYDGSAPGNTELLVKFPFDDIYIKYLFAHYAAVCGDTARYNNAAALFNAAYEQYARYLNRTRKRASGGRRLETEAAV